MKALGTYNFAGDIGKMSVPALASLMLVVLPWQPTLAIFGGLGFAAAAAIFLLAPRLPDVPARADAAKPRRTRSPARGTISQLRLSAAAGDRHGRQRHAHGAS